MTLRLPMLLAAALFLMGHAAYANPIPTSTDEARALASRSSVAQSARPVASVKNPIASSTDEARAWVGSIQHSPIARSAACVASIVSSSDEARVSAGTHCPHTDGQATACAKSCPCHRG